MSSIQSSKKYCCICGSVHQGNEKISVFKMRKEWLELLKPFKKGLTENSKICSWHFEEQDIIKGKIMLDTFYPMVNWQLAKNAVPKLFLSKGLHLEYYILKL